MLLVIFFLIAAIAAEASRVISSIRAVVAGISGTTGEALGFTLNLVHSNRPKVTSFSAFHFIKDY